MKQVQMVVVDIFVLLLTYFCVDNLKVGVLR